MAFEWLAEDFQDVYARIHGVPAETGYLDSDGSVYPDARVEGVTNKIWARINGERHRTAVWNLGRYPALDPLNAPQNIRVAYNAQGEWEVCGADSAAADTADGEVAPTRMMTRPVGALSNFVLPARNFYPGRLHPYPALGALYVGAYSFFYKDSAGATKYWHDTAATAIDLTSNIPAASGGVDTERWVVVCLNPDATTPVLVAVDGTEALTTLPQPLHETDIASVTITDGYYPLAAVKLTTGDTALIERNIVDYRLWLEKDGAVLPTPTIASFTNAQHNHQNAAGGGTLTTAAISDIASGMYTPTLTNVANLDGSTAYQCQYMRVGSVVTVSGKVDVDPTAGAATQLGISLPMASNLANAEDCAGTAFAPAIAGQGAAVLADAANNRAQMEWIAVDLTNQSMYFHFQYRII